MPNIGDALKKAVELKPDEVAESWTKVKPASVLMNPNRRRIFQFLCTYPCSDFKTMVKKLRMSRSSLSWHIERLVDAEYVVLFEHIGKVAYCPNGMVSKGNMPVFTILADGDCINIYRAVLERPGSDAGMLGVAGGIPYARVNRCMKALLDTGLVGRIRDGRHVRYFPTEKGKEVLREERPVYKDFVRKLIRRMAAEHLRPDIKELKGVGVIIEMNLLGRTEKLEIQHRNAEL